MKTSGAFLTPAPRGAFTLPELLVIIVVTSLLFLVLAPRMGSRSKAKSRRIQCVNNLKQVGLAMRIWSTTHQDAYPMSASTSLGGLSEWVGRRSLASLLRQSFPAELSPTLLSCPSDLRPPATNMASLTDKNISYFFNADADETKPRTVLAGDRNILTNGVVAGPGRLTFSGHPAVTWSQAIHNRQGNVAMGDSSVQQYGPGRITGNPGERWVVP